MKDISSLSPSHFMRSEHPPEGHDCQVEFLSNTSALVSALCCNRTLAWGSGRAGCSIEETTFGYGFTRVCTRQAGQHALCTRYLTGFWFWSWLWTCLCTGAFQRRSCEAKAKAAVTAVLSICVQSSCSHTCWLHAAMGLGNAIQLLLLARAKSGCAAWAGVPTGLRALLS